MVSVAIPFHLRSAISSLFSAYDVAWAPRTLEFIVASTDHKCTIFALKVIVSLSSRLSPLILS